MPSSEDVLVIHISDVLLQSVSLYVCATKYNMYTDAVHTVHVFNCTCIRTCAYLCTYVHQGCRGDYNGRPSAKFRPKLAMATHLSGYPDIRAGQFFSMVRRLSKLRIIHLSFEAS